jgi:DNA-binding NtrC family response regulator
MSRAGHRAAGALVAGAARAARAVAGGAQLHRSAPRFERNYLVQLLKLTDGNVADAARLAERNRTEFYRLLQKHDLDASLFRGDVAIERQDVP